VGHRHFVACSLAVFAPPADDTSLRLRRVGQAQVPPFLVRDGLAEELSPPGERIPLGAWAGARYEELDVPCRPGDVVVFASDGLPEAPRMGHPSQDGELFSFARLHESAIRAAGASDDADAIAAAIWSDVAAWCGAEPHHDDMTLLVVRVS
jgi:serine phosphatase RsbU (regulator of sigma subunit)